MALINETLWQSQSRALQEIRTANDFVRNLMFPDFPPSNTSKINIDTWSGARRMAGFVVPGAGARAVPGRTKGFNAIEAPNIRIKREFEAQSIVNARNPGTGVMIGQAEQSASILDAMQGDILYAKQQIMNTLEWMCCKCLTGVVTAFFSDTNGEAGDAFTIDYGRPAANTIVLTGLDKWDAPLATSTKPIKILITQVSRIINTTGLGTANICVMGSTAAEAFINNAGIAADMNNFKLESGIVDISKGFNQTGARFLGRYSGVEFWEYSRKVLDPWGASIDLINPVQAHFISMGPAMEAGIEYGAMEDFDVSPDTGLVIGTMFMKDWVQKDPSARIWLANSRPLPIIRRSEAVVSVTVI